ncbi:hypothetical protein P261_02003 [Lachnospiraceae bacterium TWA4]|nr:hypothetical protein P261_02003 [Lachnospiraceae bacterium TWA4]
MYNLQRFIDAQNNGHAYETALREIKNGSKNTHWIWYVFPQHVALGRSSMNAKYGITCAKEARAYIENEILRERLLEISEALYALPTNDPVSVLGSVDALKVRSCCTLFRAVAPEYEIFDKLIEKYCRGIPCADTLELLKLAT